MNPQSTQRYFETIVGQPAGFFSRMVAFIIDLFLVIFIGLVSGVMMFIILRFFRYGQILDFIGKLLGLNDRLTEFIGLISPILFLIVLLYFVFFWTLVGYTPGKALLGLRITRQDGRPLSFGRALLRYLGYWISAIPLFLGFIWILFDRRRQGWHDKISGTHVCYYQENKALMLKVER